MLIAVNGTRLFVDVENPGLVPDGDRMRQKPALVLLHGGPGSDHSMLRPLYGALRDIAQIIYYDHRGNGRSEGSNPAEWTLAQWGDDVKGLCDALGIVCPIVLGVSFGGFVAQAYATRHPDHPARLILVSTAAKVEFPAMFQAFERMGGPVAGRVARDYWMEPTAETQAAFIRVCLPFYRRMPPDPDVARRVLMRPDTALHFNGACNEQGRMDFRPDLARVRCPVLVMAGEHDPVTPMAFSEALVAALPAARTRFERFAESGHGVVGDAPDRALSVIRDFILGEDAR